MTKRHDYSSTPRPRGVRALACFGTAIAMVGCFAEGAPRNAPAMGQPQPGPDPATDCDILPCGETSDGAQPPPPMDGGPPPPVSTTGDSRGDSTSDAVGSSGGAAEPGGDSSDSSGSSSGDDSTSDSGNEESSCINRCEDYDPQATCQCDESCLDNDDCCEDYASACSGGSCEAQCGETFSSPQSCQCDDECVTNGNCCDDYEAACLSCAGQCGMFDENSPCQCDVSCADEGDCCPDIETACPAA